MGVRAARAGDAAGLAEVHVRSWQAAYRGMVPQDHLDRMDPAQRLPGWQQWLRDIRPPGAILVLDPGDGTVDGFVTVGASTEPDTDPAVVGVVMAFYLRPDRWGRGGGRELMAAAQDHLAGVGFAEAVLWVLDVNDRARRFYEAAGWSPDGATQIDDSRGFPLSEVRYRRRLRSD